ncbi:hypothetical protein BHE74_00048811 [Ensete ventricosum]|nr:hypothetical protein BHE74_00048811 [Ensete ventricosum]
MWYRRKWVAAAVATVGKGRMEGKRERHSGSWKREKREEREVPSKRRWCLSQAAGRRPPVVGRQSSILTATDHRSLGETRSLFRHRSPICRIVFKFVKPGFNLETFNILRCQLTQVSLPDRRERLGVIRPLCKISLVAALRAKLGRIEAEDWNYPGSNSITLKRGLDSSGGSSLGVQHAGITLSHNLFSLCFRLSWGSSNYYPCLRVGFKINGATPCSKGWRSRFFIINRNQYWGFTVAWAVHTTNNALPPLSLSEAKDLEKI